MNKTRFSIEVDRYNPLALSNCLSKLGEVVPDFEYNWRVRVNAGGIDYGVYLNIDIDKEEIEICNQPEYGTDGDDILDDVIKCFDEE